MYNSILIIGTGQIGKAILQKILDKEPKKIIIHNLTSKESDIVIEKYSLQYKKTKFIKSYGNIFMPYDLKDLNNKNLYEKSDEIINYFYNEISDKILKQSTIYKLIDIYKPDLIVDAINTATVLGNAYNPEYNMECYKTNAIDCCKKLMTDDYTTKIINFVYSLKYAMENLSVKKYVKVSTTGLGGMGINMPYTHGDNPKIQLSSALMGKISASGVLHQLLWNLSHTKGMNISLVIPSTFVGYDSAVSEPIETDKGLLKKRAVPKKQQLLIGKEIKYNDTISSDYLEFPVVRAGENHVYSKIELEVLTALGQMEAITKEEVAEEVMKTIYENSSKDIFNYMDSAVLRPTYSGREMIYNIEEKMKQLDFKNNPGIATGNLGVTLSKQLYELFLLKKAVPTIDLIESTSIETICNKINDCLSNDLISEIITLGIPIITNSEEIIIADYSLIPSNKENKIMTKENINKWSRIGWVDLRKENIEKCCRLLLEVYADAKECEIKYDTCINKNFNDIKNDYSISAYLAYYNNIKNQGRKK